jgi:hypothetical protein
MKAPASAVRWGFLVPAVAFFAAAAWQLFEYSKVPERYAALDIARDKIPPTAFGAHSGMALAYCAIGLIFVAFAFRKSSVTESVDGGVK